MVMLPAGNALDGLKRQHPEWAPWLSVVAEVVRETGAHEWDAAVPATYVQPQRTRPLLAGAAVTLDARAARRLMRHLLRAAARSGSPKMASLEPAASTDFDVVTVFKASLCHHAGPVQELAAATSADVEALLAVTALLPLPFLHACTRHRSAALSESWVEGYCPVCGSWPTLAEVRGIDRSRYFRCGRCSAEWHARALYCPYCSMNDHDELVSLVPEKSGAHATIDGCRRCLGYVKTFARLQACPPGTVLLEDLATVDLDVAAIEQGYTRPAGAGYALEVTVTDTGAPPRFFGWTS